MLGLDFISDTEGGMGFVVGIFGLFFSFFGRKGQLGSFCIGTKHALAIFVLSKAKKKCIS